MTNPGAGLVRVARSATLAGIVVALTVGAHRLGGGDAPGPFALVALTVLLWPVAILATRRRLRPVVLVAGLGAGQLLGHSLLGWLGGEPTADPAALGCLQHAAHVRSAAGCLADPALASGPAHVHTAGSSQMGLLMLGAHVLATPLAALVVAHGERILWRLLDLVLRVAPALTTPLTARPPRIGVVVRVPGRPELTLRTGRGPPAYAG